MRKIVLFSGSSAAGKTAVLLWVIDCLRLQGMHPAVCKIDCVSGEDEAVFEKAGVPVVAGISADICPDHYLVSNIPEIWSWADEVGSDVLLVRNSGAVQSLFSRNASRFPGA
ncbi:MAG: hypothetical protein ACLTQI_08055 [Slackia sp.]